MHAFRNIISKCVYQSDFVKGKKSFRQFGQALVAHTEWISGMSFLFDEEENDTMQPFQFTWHVWGGLP